jgi:hypothetical protein
MKLEKITEHSYLTWLLIGKPWIVGCVSNKGHFWSHTEVERGFKVGFLSVSETVYLTIDNNFTSPHVLWNDIETVTTTAYFVMPE